MCYDERPRRRRSPIAIAGDLVRRDDALSKEAAVMIRELTQACRDFTGYYPADTGLPFANSVKRLIDGE